MFFPIPSQPMNKEEEVTLLLSTGCLPSTVHTLISFAEKYRQSMSADSVQKNRKLGTRSLVRITRRLAMLPHDDDLNAIISRSLLAEFLPKVERMNLNDLLDEAGIRRRTPLVRIIWPQFLQDVKIYIEDYFMFLVQSTTYPTNR